MRLLLELFRILCGCHHLDLSRVFTLGDRTYRVCCNCGAQFAYCLETMSVVRAARPAAVAQDLRRAIGNSNLFPKGE
jgi:hypothetical protein